MITKSDCPEDCDWDEFRLAIAIQEAKARGLKLTTGVCFRDKRGREVYDEKTGKVHSCCALGALLLVDVETLDLLDIGRGNDGKEPIFDCESGYTFGQAFADAMRG